MKRIAFKFEAWEDNGPGTNERRLGEFGVGFYRKEEQSSEVFNIHLRAALEEVIRKIARMKDEVDFEVKKLDSALVDIKELLVDR